MNEFKETTIEREGHWEPKLFSISIRRDYSPQIRTLLKKIGEKKIKSIIIQRVPVESVIKGMLNLITLGNYTKTTEKLGYDKVFHLSAILTLENNERIVVEKNEVINISKKIPSGGNQMSVPISKDITLNQFLNNTREKQGSNFFIYHPFKRNCQMFIRDLLQNSGLLTNEAKEFILQDADKIIQGLPWYTSYVAKGITDLGAQFNTLIYGRGIKDKKINKDIIEKFKQIISK